MSYGIGLVDMIFDDILVLGKVEGLIRKFR